MSRGAVATQTAAKGTVPFSLTRKSGQSPLLRTWSLFRHLRQSRYEHTRPNAARSDWPSSAANAARSFPISSVGRVPDAPQLPINRCVGDAPYHRIGDGGSWDQDWRGLVRSSGGHLRGDAVPPRQAAGARPAAGRAGGAASLPRRSAGAGGTRETPAHAGRFAGHERQQRAAGDGGHAAGSARTSAGDGGRFS